MVRPVVVPSSSTATAVVVVVVVIVEGGGVVVGVPASPHRHLLVLALVVHPALRQVCQRKKRSIQLQELCI